MGGGPLGKRWKHQLTEDLHPNSGINVIYNNKAPDVEKTAGLLHRVVV